MKILGTVSEIPTKIKGWNHTFGMAKPYLKSKGNGVDVGCREGGFAPVSYTHLTLPTNREV